MNDHRNWWPTTIVIGGLALLAGSGVGLHVLNHVHDSVNRRVHDGNEIALLFAAQDATMRLVTRSQGELVGAGSMGTTDVDQLIALADSVRRVLVGNAGFSTEDRIRLESIGALQAVIEVNLAVARAHRDNGEIELAFEEAAVATARLDTLLSISSNLATRRIRGMADGMEDVVATVEARRRVLVTLGLAGLVVAVVSLVGGGLPFRRHKALGSPGVEAAPHQPNPRTP